MAAATAGGASTAERATVNSVACAVPDALSHTSGCDSIFVRLEPAGRVYEVNGLDVTRATAADVAAAVQAQGGPHALLQQLHTQDGRALPTMGAVCPPLSADATLESVGFSEGLCLIEAVGLFGAVRLRIRAVDPTESHAGDGGGADSAANASPPSHDADSEATALLPGYIDGFCVPHTEDEPCVPPSRVRDVRSIVCDRLRLDNPEDVAITRVDVTSTCTAGCRNTADMYSQLVDADAMLLADGFSCHRWCECTATVRFSAGGDAATPFDATAAADFVDAWVSCAHAVGSDGDEDDERDADDDDDDFLVRHSAFRLVHAGMHPIIAVPGTRVADVTKHIAGKLDTIDEGSDRHVPASSVYLHRRGEHATFAMIAGDTHAVSPAAAVAAAPLLTPATLESCEIGSAYISPMPAREALPPLSASGIEAGATLTMLLRDE